MELTLRGTGTLLHKSVALGDPDNPLVLEINRISAAKSKITPEERRRRDYLKWFGAMYWADDIGPVMPAANIFRSIQQGAALDRRGKDIERGLLLHAITVPLDYTGPRDLAAMWGDGQGPCVDRRMATINRAPVVNVRPAFNGWSCTIPFDLDEEVISLPDFEFLASKAGRLIHIGDYRRFFGAYRVEITNG